MDIFVLDQDFNTVHIIDSYTSLLWTGRYQEYGDFELVKPMTFDTLKYIKMGYYLWRNDSETVMIIEQIKIETDDEEGSKITVTGRSLESIVARRVIWGSRSIAGNLQNGIKTLLNENIISPSKETRKIANFVFEESDDPAVTELIINAQFVGDNLYEAIRDICIERGIGFKVTLNPTKKKFVFKLYAGLDRSYDQIALPHVVFSPTFDNFLNGTYLESLMNYKNVTLVGGEGEEAARKYTAVGDVSGLERREIFTDASSVSIDSNDDLTPFFDFTQYKNRVFNNTTKTFVTNSHFNSSRIDISAYRGRTISISIPKYTQANGVSPGYATILVDANNTYVSTLQVWESAGSPGGTTESPKAKGSLSTYELVIPNDAQYLYTSMFSSTAIATEVYSGEETDFSCTTTKLSRDEYISQLRQKGKETLSDNIREVSFDGQTETAHMFLYEKDFFNGDIVQVLDDYGHSIKARVLETIVSEDESGYKLYPTFKMLQGTIPDPEPEPELDWNTLLLIHGEAIEDSSAYAWSISNNGVIVSANQSKFGGKSLYFDGESSLQIGVTSIGLDFNADWTFDWWEYCASGLSSSSAVICMPNSDRGFVLHSPVDGKVRIFAGDPGSNWGFIPVTNIGSFYENTWVHRAICKKGKNIFCFENGVLITMVQTNGVITNTETLYIGDRTTTSLPGGYRGYLDEIRISNVARWLTNFTPPTTPYDITDQWEKPSLLPEGYTQLEYIESTGTQWIDTGFAPNHNTKVVGLFTLTSVVSAVAGDGFIPYGAAQSYNAMAFECYSNNGKFEFNYDGQMVEVGNLSAQELVHITQDKNNVSIKTANGETFTQSLNYISFTAPYTMTIFAINRGTVLCGRLKLHSFQIFDNTSIVRDYIPCATNGGNIGLYDTVNSIFYPNVGTGSFVAGPEV